MVRLRQPVAGCVVVGAARAAPLEGRVMNLPYGGLPVLTMYGSPFNDRSQGPQTRRPLGGLDG